MSEDVPTPYEYAEALVEGLRREQTIIRNAAEEAVRKADEAQKRTDSKANEFRATLADQARDLMPRTEYERLHTQLVDRVAELNSRMDRLAGQETATARTQARTIAVVGAGITFFLGVLVIVVNILTSAP